MKRKTENGKRKILIFAFCILQFSFSVACSIPSLEKPECEAARNDVREFYSYHFGGDMKNTAKNLKGQEKYLSADLQKRLAEQSDSAIDYFTQTADYPKAFRVGGCEVAAPNKTIFDILLFWKTETRSEQREINVETIKENDTWVIDKVAAKP